MSGGTKVKVDIKVPQIKAKIDNGSSLAQRWLDSQVVRDTDPYVPMLDGTLSQSATRDTSFGSGKIRYGTKYARRQYYSAPNKTKSRHPQAQMRWFEAAKARLKQFWVNGVKKAFKI